MKHPIWLTALRQAAQIKRQSQEIADLSFAYRRAIRINHRMADNLTAANRERDEARRDAELLFRMVPNKDRRAAVDLVRWRREVEAITAIETGVGE